MKNAILPQAEVDKVNEIIQKVKELATIHEKSTPNLTAGGKLEKIHTVIFLDTVKDLINSATMLRSLLEVSEKDFEDAVTQNGKVTIDDTMRAITFKCLSEILTSK